MKIFYALIFLCLMQNLLTAQNPSLELVKDGKSNYELLISLNAHSNEKKAAEILQFYFKKVTGVALHVTNRAGEKPVISMGMTSFKSEILANDSFLITNAGPNIILAGDGDRSILFAAYHFIEKFLMCKKWAPNEPSDCPKIRNLNISLPLNISESPSFHYREVYSAAELDQEYMDWYKLHRLDDFWGLWGHSFSVLVPAEKFKTHPEYFAFSKGRRRPLQLCLSNPKVLELTILKLEELFKDDPDKKFWSISPNDNSSHCECELCSAVNRVEGGPQGTLIKFVNKIAAHYPKRTFTTLAYGATARAPLQTQPLPNVNVLLSNIEIFRNNSVASEKSAAGFRNNLEGWLGKTPNVFVWDYYTQFTNYLAPFPDVLNAGANVDFYKKNKVKGVFAQMGCYSYVDHAELKTYILARKLWNDQLNEDQLLDEFLNGYYGKASPFVKEYIQKLKSNLNESGRNLDIYGNPVSEHNSYLTPEQLKEYNHLMIQAEKSAATKSIRARIRKLRLSLDFTMLQQAKFYGKEAHGIYTKNQSGKWFVAAGFKNKVRIFVKNLKAAGIKELSESGQTPEAYADEWADILTKDLPANLATGASFSFEKPWIADYPAKGSQTLTDGMYGMSDLSVNWLLFDESNTITLQLHEEIFVSTISPTFLEDQRHWIFMPASIAVAVSTDGLQYQELPVSKYNTFESSRVSTHPVIFSAKKKVRFVKLSFQPLETLPAWRSHPTKKPLVAIDEIWVN